MNNYMQKTNKKKNRQPGRNGQILRKVQFFLVPQMVKNPPAMWETWVQSLGWEDPLEKGMVTTDSIILAWRMHTDKGTNQ